MEVVSRIESRPEYLFLEVAVGARKIVEEIMLIKPGEEVVISADTSTDARVVNATAQAVAAAKATPTIIWYETRQTVAVEPPRPVAAAVQNADVWIEFSFAYAFHSPAFRAAIAHGVRYTCYTGMDVSMLVNAIARVDLAGVMKFGNTLVSLLENASDIHITTPAGTDISAKIGGRPINLRGKPAEYPGEAVMMCGQISFNPVEETQNGVLVFDGSVWPPNDLGAVREPVRAEVRKGIVTDISGGRDARKWRTWMEGYGNPNMYRVAHWSPGFNPGISAPTGRINEDERVFGGFNMGIGTKGTFIGGPAWVAPAHTDGTMLEPTVTLDGVQIEVEGKYVHPDLIPLCLEISAPGY